MTKNVDYLIETSLEAFEKRAEVKKHTGHNVRYWRNVHGGLRQLEKYPHRFDPRDEYWKRIERRVLVAYFVRSDNRLSCRSPAKRSVRFT